MANWASTCYVVEGSKETLEKIEHAISFPVIKEGSADNWEGNVLAALDPKWKQPEGSYLRGFIQGEVWWENVECTIFKFCAEEAWGRTDFCEEMKKILPDIKVYWIVEELDSELFATNDKEGKYFPERYYVDTCIDGEYDTEYFETEDEMYEWLGNSTDGKIINSEKVEEFNDKAEEECSDDFIHIFNVSIVD